MPLPAGWFERRLSHSLQSHPESRMKKNLAAAALIFFLFPKPAFSGTKEEVRRLQIDVLQLQNLVRGLHKSFDDNHSTNQSLLEQLNDQVAATNRSPRMVPRSSFRPVRGAGSTRISLCPSSTAGDGGGSPAMLRSIPRRHGVPADNRSPSFPTEPGRRRSG